MTDFESSVLHDIFEWLEAKNENYKGEESIKDFWREMLTDENVRIVRR